MASANDDPSRWETKSEWRRFGKNTPHEPWNQNSLLWASFVVVVVAVEIHTITPKIRLIF
jgi:hypothetical protein